MVNIAALRNATVIPFGKLDERLAELRYGSRIVCFCQTGVRSAVDARTLLDAGFADVVRLRGGIDASSVEIDPSVPPY